MKTALNDFTNSKEVMDKFGILKALPSFYYNRATCYVNRNWTNDDMAALRDFLFCLQLQPNNRDAHFGLLKVLRKFKQPELVDKYLELYKKRFDLSDEVKKFERSVQIDKGKLFF